MIKYRPHKGGLVESLALQVEVNVIEDLYLLISRQWGKRVVALEAKHQGVDPRTHWDTYLVLAKFEGHKDFIGGGRVHPVPVGYTDGDFSTLFP